MLCPSMDAGHDEEQGTPDPDPSQALASNPLPERESYSSLATYESCPRRYAFRYVERAPVEEAPGAFAHAAAVHRGFEAFVIAEVRAAREGAAGPGLDALERGRDAALAEARLQPDEEARVRLGTAGAFERFLKRESMNDAQPVAAELGFGLDVELPEGSGALRFVGYVDRVDRLADGTTAICDYKTGRVQSQAEVDANRQLTAYAYAAARGALRDPTNGSVLPPASRLSLYFADAGVEVLTARTDTEFAAFERDLIEMAIAVRARQFDARPSQRQCRRCEYHDTCPSSAHAAS